MRKSRLPHYYEGRRCFSISFRLADSLPQKVVLQMKTKLEEELIQINKASLSEQELDVLNSEYQTKINKLLDMNPRGSCILKEEKVAEILYQKILSYDQRYYNLKCLSIMPNHVHILLCLFSSDQQPTMDKILQLIKGGSSFQINKLLGRSGTLWARESFDRYIRDEAHYHSAFYYVVNNPGSANLEYKFSCFPYMYRCDKVK